MKMIMLHRVSFYLLGFSEVSSAFIFSFLYVGTKGRFSQYEWGKGQE